MLSGIHAMIESRHIAKIFHISCIAIISYKLTVKYCCGLMQSDDFEAGQIALRQGSCQTRKKCVPTYHKSHS